MLVWVSVVGADALQLARQSISDPKVLAQMEAVLTSVVEGGHGKTTVDASVSKDTATVECMADGGQHTASVGRKQATTVREDSADPFSRALRDLYLNEEDRSVLEAELITDEVMLKALTEDDLISIGILPLLQRRARSEASQASVP